MGGLKTFIPVTALTLLLAQAPPVRANPSDDLMPRFAACAGRLSALMEHQWLISDPASDHTRARREAVVAVLEAVTPPELEAKAMQVRLEAKVAQAGLLWQAHFGQEPARAAWAARRAEGLVAGCLAQVVG